jgi:hypothetical protein
MSSMFEGSEAIMGILEIRVSGVAARDVLHVGIVVDELEEALLRARIDEPKH